MAESLLSSAVERLLSKAISLAGEEISNVWNVKENLQNLVRQVKIAQALLTVAGNQGGSSRAVVVGPWLERLEDVVSQANYYFDELLDDGLLPLKVETGKMDKVRNFFSFSNVKRAHQVKKINLNLDEVFQEAEKIGLRPMEIVNTTNGTTVSLPLEITDPFVDDSEIVGRIDDVEKLVRALTNCLNDQDEHDLLVTGIVGMPGQGKTTVAQLVCKHDGVIKHFQTTMWLPVSNNGFNVERLLNAMLELLTGTSSKLMMREALVKRLNKELNAKRFLLVLDDVWNEDESLWNSMKKCLKGIGGSKESRILVTTRSEKVLSTMRTSLVLQLGTLSDDESWKLFESRAFRYGGATKSPELMDIGKRIVKNCGGVPLAITTIGSMMSSKRDEREWSNIEQSKIWSSLDAGAKVLSAIELSYINLPFEALRRCFAFCSIFCNYRYIGKENLIQLWAAEGLLNSTHGTGSQLEMEELGDEYFNILLERRLFHNPKTDEYGNIEYCEMHDLMHEFALKASKNHSLVLDGGDDKMVNVDMTNVVHLSIFLTQSLKQILTREVLSRLRTLIVVGDLEEDMLAQCKNLRALAAFDRRIKDLTSSIGKLKRLRYLNISGTSIATLPQSVTKLSCLQTLKLNGLTVLSKDLGNLRTLRHVHVHGGVDAVKKCVFPNIGQLTSLRTLPSFVVSPDCHCEQLGSLDYLRGELKILGLENVKNAREAMKANLSRKRYLDGLQLHWGPAVEYDSNRYRDVLEGFKPHSNLKGLAVVNFRGLKLPSWMLTTSHPLILRNIVKIQLQDFSECEDIPPLGHLPFLKIVKIIGMKRVKYIKHVFYGDWKVAAAFPALKEFIIRDMPELEYWSNGPFSGEVFQHLEIVKVEKCQKLKFLPESICRNLVSLRELSIVECVSLILTPKDLRNLKSLEKLKLSSCRELDIHRITLGSLRDLDIEDCQHFKSLPHGIDSLSSLTTLSIAFCLSLETKDLNRLSNVGLKKLCIGGFKEGLDYFPLPDCTCSHGASSPLHEAEYQMPLFVSLEILALYGWESLTNLPTGIQNFSALRNLGIYFFDGMEDLPEWLGNLHSLEFLYIQNCKKLRHFPSKDAMQCLTNLMQLTIKKCAGLEETCKKQIGKEWYKIAHIPKIIINDVYLEHQESIDI